MKIVDTDAFLDMPAGSQLLYFHLAMRADDDGFVSNPKKVMRMIGSQEDDYKVLLAKRFLIPFESGVCVIKHWRMHNLIRGDRYRETSYLKEKGKLMLKENGSYTERNDDVIPNGNHMEPQVRLGKVRLGKNITSPEDDELFVKFWTLYPKKVGKVVAFKKWSKLPLEVKNKALAALPNHTKTEQWKEGGGRYIPHPTTWLNQERWNDDVSTVKEVAKEY